MTLAAEDLDQIRHLVEEVVDQRVAHIPANVRYEFEIRERIVRVEEELKHQRELMEQGFALMEKRFELIEKRFEQIDKRFEELREDMQRQFEAVDRRFESLVRRMDRMMFWTFATIITVGTLVVAAIRYLPPP